MANDITGQDILNAYRASIHPDVQKKLLKVNDINAKYKLTPGTETDFNNAATFYMYAQVKNSEAIDKAETDLSRLFGSVLEDYYTTYVNNGKLTNMLSAINSYNTEINNLYTQKDSANAERILKNIYGIDPKTFEITEGSYAYRVLLELRERYVNRILPRLEIYEMILRLRERINPYNSYLVTTESTIDPTVRTSVMNIINEEFVKSSGVLKNPTITYTYTIDANDPDNNETIVMHLDNGSIKIEDDGINNGTFTLTSTNSNAAWRNMLRHLRGFLYVYGNADVEYKDIESRLFKADEDASEETFSFEFTSDPIAANEITYNFSSYEKQFLLFSTFLYIYNKIYKNTDNVIIKNVNDYQGDIESLIKYNDDMSETLVELNDGIDGAAGTRCVAREYDIYNTIKIKLSETIQLPDINIRIGYLKDPYVQLRGDNTPTTLQSYEFHGDETYNISRISKETVKSYTDIYDIVQGGEWQNTNGILREGIPPGLFSYPELRKSYAILDSKNLYIYLKTISSHTTSPNRIGRIVVNDGSGADRKIIFDDITNTNLFSKMSHGDYKTYIYEDKTTSLYSEIKDEDSFIRQTLIPDDSEDLECGGDFEKEYDVVLNSFKIYYEFNKPSAQDADKTMDELTLLEKRHASDVEAYYALNYNNVNYLEFDNIIVDVKSLMYEELSTMFFSDNEERSDANIYGFRPGTNDQYTVVSFSILYKEFNPVIRDIDLSNIQNRIISEYYQEVSQNILNTKIYDYISDYKNVESIGAIPADMGKIFVNLHTNPYVVRHSAVDDIVSYISGDIINFGVTSQEKEEVQMLLNIYKETRDYFYKVLLNKAFILEDQYTLFKHLYIKAYSIERFISSRLTNITEIKYYTATDCRNFLISYGLKTLSDQVDAADFADSLVYKKRIIANYNTLMSSKGSRAIIDEFFKLFNYDTTEIELYKYLLYKDSPIDNAKSTASTTYLNTDYNEMLKFVPIKYESANISYGIKNNFKKAKKYSEFLLRDNYWDENELTPQIMADTFDSPVNTKYMGIDLKKDIYMSYIRSKYVLSLIQYLYNQFDRKMYTQYTSEDRKYLNNIKIALSSIESGSDESGEEYTLLDTYNAVRFLFALYVTLSEHAYGGESGGDDEVARAKYSGIAHNDDKHAFYGINPSGHITNLKFENTFLTQRLVNRLFTTEYIKSDKTLSGDHISYYANGLYRVPGISRRSPSTTEASDLLFGQNTALPVEYMIPLRLETPTTATRNKLFDTTDFANLQANTEEIFTNDAESIEMDSEENSAFSCIDTAFKSINLINFLNGLDSASSAHDENNKKFQAVYYFEKFANSKAVYPAALSELGQLSDPATEFKFPDSSNFYSYLFEKVLDFPLNYLDGEYNGTKNINYTYDIREILSEIFNEFFVVKGSNANDAIGYLDPTYSSGVITFNNNAFVEETLGTSIEGKNPVIAELLGDLNTNLSRANSKWKFTLPTDIDSTISTIADRLIAVCGIINTAAEQYQLMKLDLQFGESLNNFFDFIKTCISFFISYTSMLYESNLILKIETKNERVPLTYKIYDKIEQNQHDYLYYDEDIQVDEIIDS